MQLSQAFIAFGGQQWMQSTEPCLDRYVIRVLILPRRMLCSRKWHAEIHFHGNEQLGTGAHPKAKPRIGLSAACEDDGFDGCRMVSPFK